MDSSFNLNNRSINGTSPSTDLGNTDNNTQELGTDQSFIGVPDNNDGYNINQLFIDGDFTEDYQQRIMERDVIGSTQRQQPPQQQQQQQQPGLITEVGIGQQYSDLSAEYLLEIEYFTQDTYNQLVDLDENGYQKRLNELKRNGDEDLIKAFKTLGKRTQSLFARQANIEIEHSKLGILDNI